MCISLDYTRYGWGTKLFNIIKKNCLDLNLNKIKLISVGSSPSYWKRLGFEEKELIPQYNGYLMEKTIC
jgi:N-acetylglutamate synthase-like GNAT family acetyltransferase